MTGAEVATGPQGRKPERAPAAQAEQAGSEESRAADAALALETKRSERADVLATLRRRRVACTVVMESSVDFADEARVMVRQIDVLIGIIAQGLHEGAAVLEAALADDAGKGDQ